MISPTSGGGGCGMVGFAGGGAGNFGCEHAHYVAIPLFLYAFLKCFFRMAEFIAGISTGY